jgi:Uncharacterized conserved protein
MILADSAPFPGWAIAIIVVAVVLVIIVVSILGWWISAANRLRREQVKIDEAASGIDVALTKRFDLLTKEVAVVKGYAKHESETLTNVISMRQPAANASMAARSSIRTISKNPWAMMASRPSRKFSLR